MILADLLDMLKNLPPTAQVWVQPANAPNGAKLCKVSRVETVGDSTTPGVREGDIVLRFEPTRDKG